MLKRVFLSRNYDFRTIRIQSFIDRNKEKKNESPSLSGADLECRGAARRKQRQRLSAGTVSACVEGFVKQETQTFTLFST